MNEFKFFIHRISIVKKGRNVPCLSNLIVQGSDLLGIVKLLSLGITAPLLHPPPPPSDRSKTPLERQKGANNRGMTPFVHFTDTIGVKRTMEY